MVQNAPDRRLARGWRQARCWADLARPGLAVGTGTPDFARAVFGSGQICSLASSSSGGASKASMRFQPYLPARRTGHWAAWLSLALAVRRAR